MPELPFSQLTDEELGELAVACVAAYGEGAFDEESTLVPKLRAEFRRRGLDVPCAYDDGTYSIELWMNVRHWTASQTQ